jgi:hypothetical protein
MTDAPLTTAPEAARTSHQRDALNAFVDLGHRLVRLAVDQSEAKTLPVEKAASIYDRVTRSVRRSIWLERHLAEPVNTIDRVAARKRIIRRVEDTIQRHAEDEEAETLHEELRERLDSLDLEDEIRGRKLEDIITDIVRDLGLVHVPGTHPWKRRTPQDIDDICIRAAQETPSIRATPPTQAPRAVHGHPDYQSVGYNST